MMERLEEQCCHLAPCPCLLLLTFGGFQSSHLPTQRKYLAAYVHSVKAISARFVSISTQCMIPVIPIATMQSVHATSMAAMP